MMNSANGRMSLSMSVSLGLAPGMGAGVRARRRRRWGDCLLADRGATLRLLLPGLVPRLCASDSVVK
jgi:hypothetical protein